MEASARLATVPNVTVSFARNPGSFTLLRPGRI
jgi:hypothetical protein